MDKILLIDGLNSLWRANVRFGPPLNHALCQDCTNPKHKGTSHCQCGSLWHSDNFCYGDKYYIVYNFFRNLRPIIEQFSPVKCFFVLEGHPKFRHTLYSEYKANRLIKEASKQESRQFFFDSVDLILPLLQHLPITICKAADYEADDVISTLCESLKDEDLTVLSSDSDFIQLLQKGYSNIRIYNPIKKECMIAPEYPYVLWKSLAGDKSDNIPALLKPKKALETSSNPELLKKFLSVEENRANFSINRQLIEFRSVPEDEINMINGYSDYQALREEFDNMAFQSITNADSWKKYTSTFDCIKY